MSEHEVLTFLLSLAVLLATARALGEVARALGMPLVVGEILAGIVLGPTALGRLWPDAYAWLFASGTPAHMLGAYTTLAVVLLLVVAGLEVDLGVLRRRGASAALTALLGIAMPLAGGWVLGALLPASDLVHPDQRGLFAVFLGVALSISALPVIAKTLLDLGLFKTDIGLLVMAAAMIDDVVGWLGVLDSVGPDAGGRGQHPSYARHHLLDDRLHRHPLRGARRARLVPRPGGEGARERLRTHPLDRDPARPLRRGGDPRDRDPRRLRRLRRRGRRRRLASACGRAPGS